MIQHRTFELLKQPQTIQAEDLPLLEKEIAKYPYMQSLRALYLYGNHQYNPEAYKVLLSLTAVYTTDKKNLYQLIKREELYAVSEQSAGDSHPPRIISDGEVIANSEKREARIEEREEPAVTVEQSAEESYPPRIISDGEVIANSEKREARIEEGEEPAVTIEQSAGDSHTRPIISDEEVAITNSEKREAKSEEREEPAVTVEQLAEESHPPRIISDEEVITNSEKREAKSEERDEISKPLSKHEEEMKRLIAEVEAKMAKNRATKKQEIPQEEPLSTEINFNEYHREHPADHHLENWVEPAQEDLPQQREPTHWKPLNFELNTPDAFLKKEEPQVVVQQPPQILEDKQGDTPSSGEQPHPQEKVPQSNVPKFINTWQSWLKLSDSSQPSVAGGQQLAVSEEKPKAESRESIALSEKSKVIDTFIENNPKISKINKELSEGYAPKDKGDDISHLMTETLANLYVEQRLYAKSIQAFKLLMKKYPEKKDHFKARIQEVKELRTHKNSDE